MIRLHALRISPVRSNLDIGRKSSRFFLDIAWKFDRDVFSIGQIDFYSYRLQNQDFISKFGGLKELFPKTYTIFPKTFKKYPKLYKK